MSVQQLLPMMEVVYNRKKTTYFKLAHNPAKGTHVVAIKDIEGGAVVLVEKAMYVQPTRHHSSLAVDPDFQSLIAIIDEKEDSCNSQALRDALDRVAELSVTAYIQGSSQKEEVWKLEDSHRHARVGDNVQIEGLASEAGKKLNGSYGHVSKMDEKDASRLGVVVSAPGGRKGTKNKSKHGEMVRSIKPCNLKTLGGIMRTNAYHDTTLEAHILFKDLCRFNHACCDAANLNRTIHHGKAYVVAKRDILCGEELMIDYLAATVQGQNRLELLHNMFNFRCQCPEH
ncbi:expressed unknown protein [Seminavis robusta]|uniref:SET domain-containing protein n=1 Tax=Seminavis robusta TaxID=568900 RepID=A0A9N8E609_9STRA|nr:expressed unknown protein [Seminavis robusta]|eukprot:Sro586_g171120.1 n/a (285) ;mRNA; f:15953-16807